MLKLYFSIFPRTLQKEQFVIMEFFLFTVYMKWWMAEQKAATSLIKMRNCFYWKWHACNDSDCPISSCTLIHSFGRWRGGRRFRNVPKSALACLPAAATVPVSGRRVGGWSHSFPLLCDLKILGMMIRSEVIGQFECLPVFQQRKTNLNKWVNFTLILMDHETERCLEILFLFQIHLICLPVCFTCLMIPSCRLGWTQERKVIVKVTSQRCLCKTWCHAQSGV